MTKQSCSLFSLCNPVFFIPLTKSQGEHWNSSEEPESILANWFLSLCQFSRQSQDRLYTLCLRSFIRVYMHCCKCPVLNTEISSPRTILYWMRVQQKGKDAYYKSEPQCLWKLHGLCCVTCWISHSVELGL